MSEVAAERRVGPDRRANRVSFRYPERRSGFDRRDRSAWQRWLLELRERPGLVGAIIVAIVVLSAADLLLTRLLLERGAHEANPVMARLLEAGLLEAALVKGLITAAVAAGIWALRRYRRIIELSLGLALVFGLLVAYQAAGLAISA